MNKEMNAIGFDQHLPIDNPDSFKTIKKTIPDPKGHELLVKVNGISVNPVDIFSRRSGGKGKLKHPKIIGWDAVGTVVKAGSDVSLFHHDDRVWYAGDITKDGSDEPYQIIDERIVGSAPRSLEDSQAAAVPLVSLTAYEALFEKLPIQIDNQEENKHHTILIINGAGGVGSMAVQLAHLAGLKVIATASNEKSIQWVRRNGADEVVNHHQDLVSQVRKLGHHFVDYALNLNNLDAHWDELAELIRPDGWIAATTENRHLIDLQKLTKKRATFTWEWMYTKAYYQTKDMITQHQILDKISELYDQKKLLPIMRKHYSPINIDNLKKAHADIETGHTIGKITLTKWE
ncbi:NADPH:quinone reductase [Philodulcilactobacillus myokoensis]|uniref:Zinc-type alcohol dehydrogenase-like protein n=1 Tax=Philodulcilactobacillus myokoensis TaxID=2929573 RepID=A0A9W6B4X3_9LACO|nr:zinc-binding alcohol dehydrogenase family protein [Philodulcilactobacillus myokoensis]GLB47549.1 NADPH:quinone reductase [Philodulcilactobacillus myokoensis]